MNEITPIREESYSPLSVTHFHTEEETNQNSSLFPYDLNSSIQAQEKKKEFTSEFANINDNFLKELEKDIFAESEDIERYFAELRGLRRNNLNQLKENLLGRGNLKFSSLNFSSPSAQEGADFLTNLFPDAIIEELALDPLELNPLARLTITFLHSISTQSIRTQLLCKEKLLKKSVELKKKLSGKINKNPTTPPSPLLVEAISLWEASLLREEKQLKSEKHQFSNMKSKDYLTTRYTSSLTNIFNTLVVGPLTYIFDLSWITRLFNIFVVGLSLKKIRSENESLDTWRKNYAAWRSKYQPTLERSESGAMRLNPKLAVAEKTIKKPYEKLEILIQTENVSYSLDQLADSGLKLPSRIKTKDDLIRFLEVNPKISQHYEAFTDRINSLNTIIATSESLLEKRQATKKKKLYHLASRFLEIKETIKVIKFEEFKRIENKPADLLFEAWFDNHGLESLLNDYIDHQETIEHAVKNSLKEIIQKKYELETVFQKFKSAESHAVFFMTTALFTTSVALFTIGMLSTPVGGIGFIFLGFSAVSALMTVGFMAAGYLYAKKYRPATSELMTTSFQTRLAITNLRKSIANYFHRSKKKKLAETARILYELRPNPISSSSSYEESPKKPKEAKALENYQKAKKAFQESLDRVDYWGKSLNKFEAEIEKAGAKDVVKFGLPGNNRSHESLSDPLKELQYAVKKLDFSLLSPETKALFEEQLGISLEVLQNQVKANPNSFRGTWEKFFSLRADPLFDFIIIQRERIKKNEYLNPSLPEIK